jgi:hypothetical protein
MDPPTYARASVASPPQAGAGCRSLYPDLKVGAGMTLLCKCFGGRANKK